MAKTAIQDMPRRFQSHAAPPPNARYVAVGQKFIGNGSPEGVVFGYIGDEYLDLSTREEWSKMTQNEHAPTEYGWEKNQPVYTQPEVNALLERFVTAADLTELADRDFSENYHTAIVESDENGEAGLFFWDPSITTADAVTNNIIPLVDGIGGFKRKGF